MHFQHSDLVIQQSVMLPAGLWHTLLLFRTTAQHSALTIWLTQHSVIKCHSAEQLCVMQAAAPSWKYKSRRLPGEPQTGTTW